MKKSFFSSALLASAMVIGSVGFVPVAQADKTGYNPSYVNLPGMSNPRAVAGEESRTVDTMPAGTEKLFRCWIAGHRVDGNATWVLSGNAYYPDRLIKWSTDKTKVIYARNILPKCPW
ncbi:MAG: hypothetical protein FWF12_06405 [Betaproteobacteria bacterium]|nr:hypothetical protein [Betaproteobacteria bacterium]